MVCASATINWFLGRNRTSGSGKVFVMDTDHLSLLQLPSGSVGGRLRERILALPEDEVAATIISFEEQTRGWLAFQASARSLDRQVNVRRISRDRRSLIRAAHPFVLPQQEVIKTPTLARKEAATTASEAKGRNLERG
jgi:hypothetical protein